MKSVYAPAPHHVVEDAEGFVLLDAHGDAIVSLPLSTCNHSTDELRSTAHLFAAAHELLAATKGLLAEWEKLTRYGSPMAKAANERIQYAKLAVLLVEPEA